MDTKFGTWNVESFFRVGSLTVIAREVAKYKLELMGVHEDRWHRGSSEPVGDYTFFYGT
jgi:hypothetical protein